MFQITKVNLSPWPVRFNSTLLATRAPSSDGIINPLSGKVQKAGVSRDHAITGIAIVHLAFQSPITSGTVFLPRAASPS